MTNRGDEKLWFRSDEDHCPDGKCAVTLVNKKNVENKDVQTTIEEIKKVDKGVNTFQEEENNDELFNSNVINKEVDEITIEMQEVTENIVNNN